jgi:hypothetical protein
MTSALSTFGAYKAATYTVLKRALRAGDRKIPVLDIEKIHGPLGRLPNKAEEIRELRKPMQDRIGLLATANPHRLSRLGKTVNVVH